MKCSGALAKHSLAFNLKNIPLTVCRWRHMPGKRKGEVHLFKATIHLLQYATRMNDYNIFKKYSKAVNVQYEKPALCAACSVLSAIVLPFLPTR